MAFSPTFLDDIRTRLSLVAVIGKRVRLTRKGREFTGLCPFHNEKSPSFSVNEDKGFYHCFGCGAHGDVITFEMQTASLSFPEAVERLAQDAGLEVPVQSPVEREQAKRSASLQDATEAACRYFERELRGAAGGPARDYLAHRGLDEQTIARFRLGFAPEQRIGLKQFLAGQSVPEALSVEGGLLIQPDGGGETYDRFRGRVMFPITDRRGRLIAFGGRTMGDGQPKYLNSPDTPLFHKGRVLYGLAQAREPAAMAGTVIVCEGYMDVIALHRAGFAHAVAPLGTALTKEQIALLWRMAAEPIICLDGDAAGQRAAAKAAERALPLLKPGQSLRFATVPAPEDPDSLIRARGPAAMQEVLDRALPLSELLWRLEVARQPIDTPERRAALDQALMEKAGRIADRAVQEQYRALFRERLRELFRPQRPQFRPAGPAYGGGRGAATGGGRGMPFGPVRRRAYDRGADGRLPGAGLPPPPSPAWQGQERLLLRILIQYPTLLEDAAERLGSLQFSDSALDKLRQEVLKHLDGWGSLDSEGARRHLQSCGFSQSLDCLLEASAHERSASAKPDAASVEAARELWEHIFKLYTQKELAAELKQAEQQYAANPTDEALRRLNALWSSTVETDSG